MTEIAIPIGLLIGLSLGALGGGGSILTVPALVYLLGQSPHAATTGSLLIVGITAVAGMVAHRRAGRVRLGQGVTFGVLGIGGSYVGTRLSASVDPHVLLTAFAGLMLVAAAGMLRRGRRAGGDASAPAADHAAERGPVGGDVPVGPVAPDPQPGSAGAPSHGLPDLPSLEQRGDPGAVALLARPAAADACTLPSAGGRLDTCRVVKVVAAATVVGILTGFFGVGGGFVIVPALVLALGFRMPEAVGTSLLVIAINSAASLAARLGGHAHLDWTLLGVFTAAAVVGSVLGNRVASRIDAARLTVAFTVLLLAVAVYTAARSIPHLV